MTEVKVTTPIQKESPPTHTYSAIIIGAGMGGLGAATQLALAGEKVLLLEKHSTPGGFATSFVRGRFEFEAALHELSGCGTAEKPGGIYRYLEQLKIIPDKLQMVKAPEMYSAQFLDGERYDLPYGIENYKKYLSDRFPSEKENLEKFFKVVANVYEGISGPIKPFRILFKYPWIIRMIGMNVEEFVSRFFTNRRLINVIQQYWAYLSNCPANSNALLFCGTLMTYCVKGAVYPNKRSHHFSMLLAQAVIERGGDVKYNALVNRILIEDGKAVGVELLNGERFFAKAIISNVNPICTVTKMLPKGAMKEAYIRRLFVPPIGSSIFNVYLGLNKSPQELGLDRYEVFINSSDNLTEDAMATGIEETRIMATTCYNFIMPDISPPGTSMVALCVLHPGIIWQDIPPTEYNRIKEDVANHAIALFEKTLCPKVRSAIEVIEIASPLTFYRYSKHLQGTIYGTNSDILDSPVFKLGNKTPLKGLYICGSWTGEGGGYDPCFNSGRKAARYVLKEIGKPIP